MRPEDKKKLFKNRRIIVNHLLDLESVLDYLISKQIFTPSIRESIIYENKSPRANPHDQIRQTLDSLVKKNALAYTYFIEALTLTNNTHIVNTIEPDYQTSEECKLMIERERIVLPSLLAPNSNSLHHISSNPNTPQHNNTSSFTKHSKSFGQNISPSNEFPPGQSSIQGQGYTSIPQYQNELTPTQVRQIQLSMHYQNIMFQNQMQQQQPPNLQNCRYPSNFSTSTNNSRSSSQSQSMSPITNRARSSSVTGFYNLSNSNSRNLKTKKRTGSGALGNLIDEENCRYPVSVSSYDDSDQTQHTQAPLYINNKDTAGHNSELPPTYNIDWSDVNNLELDFVVYKTFPNTQKQLSPDECYCMEKNPRGLCLLINNEHFYDEDGKEIMDMRRYGTDMDASRLKNLFEKLNFQVEMCVDQTEQEMRNKITLFANESDSNSLIYDAICLIVLSHGTDGYVYGVDVENRINMDKDILSLFDDILIGKPKLFIFQACRGEHLNQKDSVQNPLSFITQSNSTNSIHQSSKPPLYNKTRITPASSLTSMDDETIKKFKNLKVTSREQKPTSLQLNYIKKKKQVKSASNSSSTSSNSSLSMSLSSNSSSTKMKTRSRSHSRGKYSAYLASAASAIKTVCKNSPNSSKSNLASISTQTNSQTSSSSQSLISSQDGDLEAEPVLANCYPNSNIITSTTHSQSLMNFTDGRPIKTCLPSRSDFFIWYSSARGFVSHRELDGSPFIKCLVTVFSRCAYDLELIEMVRKVNLLMQQYEKIHFDERNAVASYFMVPVAEFHLAKRLYFNP